MTTRGTITLVGDSIENPWNARTMIDAAAMFGGACRFRDHGRLAVAWQEAVGREAGFTPITHDELARDYSPIVACDNAEGAASVYGFRLPAGARPAVVVGNERRGITRDIQCLAQCAVEIPLVSRTLNTLNVAAAAAVALYYLWRGGGGAQPVTIHPERRRPELLLLGAADHVELGSTIRSAGAFGWQRLFVDDRHRVWFGSDRGARAEGRAAARRARNPIQVIPAPADRQYLFADVAILTARARDREPRETVPLHRANLARGRGQLIVIPDESGLDVHGEDWRRLGQRVQLVRVDLPARDFAYHYRLVATIALAEVARQVGRRARPDLPRPRRPEPLYDSALNLLAEEQGETVYVDELERY